MNIVVLGMFRGDEGKGKIVDYFTPFAKLAVRFNGSCNAGHTLIRNGKELVLHQIPSAILSGIPCLIAHGCLVNLEKLIIELDEVDKWAKEGLIDLKGKKARELLNVAYGCHLIQQKHIDLDILREETGRGNGSTRQGISPAYSDKYLRSGIRIADSKDAREKLKGMLIDDTTYLNSIILENIIFEGAQGVMLDIDSAYYPNVSSSSVGIGGLLAGTGINYIKLMEDDILEVVGVAKAYMTSVGVGYFPTEIKDNSKYNVDKLREISKEYGATTGRPRKIGILDLPMLRYSANISGVTSIALTRLDTLREMFTELNQDIPVCINYMVNKKIIDPSSISLYNLESYKPVYKTFKCWKKESFDDKNFCKFIDYITTYIPEIDYISIGPGKDDIIEIGPGKDDIIEICTER